MITNRYTNEKGINLEKTFEDKYEEEWPNIKKEIDNSSIDYCLANPLFLIEYSKRLGITQTELKKIINERYKKE